jgi:hypothetical protein
MHLYEYKHNDKVILRTLRHIVTRVNFYVHARTHKHVYTCLYVCVYIHTRNGSKEESMLPLLFVFYVYYYLSHNTYRLLCVTGWVTQGYFFFSFGVLQLILPEAPQPYGLLYYPRIGLTTFSTSSALPRPLSRKSWSCKPAFKFFQLSQLVVFERS